VTQQIIICTSCKGKGFHELNELVDYHKGDYRYWNEICTRCRGSGRMIERKTTEYIPFIQLEQVDERETDKETP
jgi:DnaJ-class molecular chaperone